VTTKTRSEDTRPEDFMRHLEREAPLPAYAIVGEEEFARGQCLRALRQALLREADPEMALSQYEGSEVAEPTDLISELRTPAFLAPRRVVIVENAEPFLAKARDLVANYLAKPASTSTLVLTCAKLARSDKVGAAVRKVGMVVACAPPRERELPGWISARARAHRKRIELEAARRLAEYVGVNLPVLDHSLAKLALYVGDRPTITAADVEAMVEDLPVTTIFKLTDALGSQQVARALTVLDHLLERNNDPNYILSMVRWALERLINARTLLDLGKRPEAIGKVLRMRPGYFLDQTLRQARRRTRADYERCFALLLEADLATKTSAADPRHILERLIIELCA